MFRWPHCSPSYRKLLILLKLANNCCYTTQTTQSQHRIVEASRSCSGSCFKSFLESGGMTCAKSPVRCRSYNACSELTLLVHSCFFAMIIGERFCLLGNLASWPPGRGTLHACPTHHGDAVRLFRHPTCCSEQARSLRSGSLVPWGGLRHACDY